MFPSLPLWAGMPGMDLTDTGRLRIESLSFFAVIFLLSAWFIQLVWNLFRRDFPTTIPRLGFGQALGLTILWGLLFVLVLTMISGARELLTPGAWKKQGWTYALADAHASANIEEITDTIYRQKIEDLRFALWDHARKNGGQFPSSSGETSFPSDRWQVPGSSGLRYLYSANQASDPAVPLAWEPEVFGAQRLVLFSDGTIGSMDSSTLERLLKRGER